jgi:hypothetical protein
MIIDTEKLLAAVDRHYMARCKTVEDTVKNDRAAMRQFTQSTA